MCLVFSRVRNDLQGAGFSLVTGFLCVLLTYGQFVYFVFFMFLVYFLLFVLCCQYQCKWLPGKTRLRNDLLCVERDVKLYSLTTRAHVEVYYTLLPGCYVIVKL